MLCTGHMSSPFLCWSCIQAATSKSHHSPRPPSVTFSAAALKPEAANQSRADSGFFHAKPLCQTLQCQNLPSTQIRNHPTLLIFFPRCQFHAPRSYINPEVHAYHTRNNQYIESPSPGQPNAQRSGEADLEQLEDAKGARRPRGPDRTGRHRKCQRRG